MRFSIAHVEADLPYLGRQKLYFSSGERPEDNMTIIIGKNGSGKSTLLRELHYWARKLNGKVPRFGSDKVRILENVTTSNPNYSSSQVPSRVIALSFTPFDKFPPRDDVARGGNELKPFYVYLGFKNQYGGTGSRSKLLQLIDIVVFREPERKFNNGITHVLNDIGYRPEFLVKYKLTEKFRSFYRRFNNFNGIEAQRLDLRERNAYYYSELEKNNIYSRRVEYSEQKFRTADKYGADFIKEAEPYLSEALIGHWVSNPPEIHVDLAGGKLAIVGQSTIFGPRSNDDARELELIHRLVKQGLIVLDSAEIYAKHSNSGLIDLFQLSSGELNLIVGFLGLGIYLQDGSLVLIDEPENSLHPAWQERYAELLRMAFKGFENCHFVIATHSPIILAGVSSDNACVVRLDQLPCNLNGEDFLNMASDATLVTGFGVIAPGNSYLRQVALEALTLIRVGKTNDYKFLAIQKLFRDNLSKFENNDPILKFVKAILEHP